MIPKLNKTKLSQIKIRNGETRNKFGEGAKSKKEREIKQSEELQQYLRKITRISTMSLDQENRLWREIKKKEGDKRLEGKIFETNLRLVISIAKKYRDNDSLTFFELIKAGEEGLKRAIEVFKWRRERRKKFSSYAEWWIRRAITEAIANGWLPGDLRASEGIMRKT